MDADFQLEGFEELKKLLGALPGEMEKRVLFNAARQGANVVRRVARQNAPKDSGQLRRNIKIRVLRPAERAKYHPELGKSSPIYRVYAGGKGFYGRFYEYGTSRQPARPFFRPAIESSREEVQRTMKAYLLHGLQTQAAALATRFGTVKSVKISRLKRK